MAAERKKVSFNIKTASCGLCRANETDFSEADDIPAREAVAFCKTCGQFLCSLCLKPHRKLVVAENHQLLNRDHVNLAEDQNGKGLNGTNGFHMQYSTLQKIASLPASAIHAYEGYRAKIIETISKDYSKPDDLQTNDTADDSREADEAAETEEVDEEEYQFTEYCGEHREYFLKYFCEQHDQLCCENCLQTDHKLCFSKVKHIQEEVKTFETFPSPFKKIDAQIADFKDYDRKLQCDLKELKKSRETFLHDLKIKKRDILNWLNLMEVRAVRRLEIVFDKCKKDIEKKRQKAKQACEELRAETYFLKEILHNETFDDVYKFIKMKKAEEIVSEVQKKKEHRQFTNTRFGLKINEDFEKVRTDGEQLYELNFERKGETKFNVRLKEDKHVCNITGCAILPVGGVALADRNNAKVKVFNSQYKLNAKLNVPDGLFDLTCLSSNAVAVTSPLKSKINIIEIRPEPEIVKVINTGTGSCWGIKHHNEVFFVNCSTAESSYIRAIDLDSNILFQVETKCNFSSEILIDEDTNRIVVSTASSFADGKNNEMVQYVDEHKAGENEEFSVLEYHYLTHLHTRGITVDSHSNLIVCCKDTDQIYTIARIGNEVELLLAEADGICTPQALCYNKDRSKLLVTSENTDFIQMFEFDT